MKWLYIYNNKRRKNPLIYCPYSEKTKGFYIFKGYIVKEVIL